jgi:hypothetical protein
MTLVVPADAAQPGEVVVAYGANRESFLFAENAAPIGYPALSSPLSPLIPQPFGHFSQAAVNGESAEILYAGLTPSLAPLDCFKLTFAYRLTRRMAISNSAPLQAPLFREAPPRRRHSGQRSGRLPPQAFDERDTLQGARTPLSHGNRPQLAHSNP